MRIPVRKLITSINEVKVFPNTPLSEVLNKMSINRLSALPVVSETGTLQGVITVFAIIQVWKNPGATPNNLVVSSTAFEQLTKMRPVPLAADKDLYDHIDQFISSGRDHLYIIDNDTDKNAIGVVSKSRLIEVLFEISQPYILAKEIEENLKGHIVYAYKDETTLSSAITDLSGSAKDINSKALALVSKLHAEKKFTVNEHELQGRVDKIFPVKSSIRTLKDLTFSELLQLLQSKVAWSEVEQSFWPFDMNGWTQRILPALGARNDVFHFRKDIDQGIIDELAGCADWLNTCHIPERSVPTTEPIVNAHTEDEVAESFKSFVQRLEVGKTVNTTQIHFISTIQSIAALIPQEASTDAEWWRVESVYTRQWTEKGWRVTGVDIEEGYVTFSAALKR